MQNKGRGHFEWIDRRYIYQYYKRVRLIIKKIYSIITFQLIILTQAIYWIRSHLGGPIHSSSCPEGVLVLLLVGPLLFCIVVVKRQSSFRYQFMKSLELKVAVLAGITSLLLCLPHPLPDQSWRSISPLLWLLDWILLLLFPTIKLISFPPFYSLSIPNQTGHFHSGDHSDTRTRMALSMTCREIFHILLFLWFAWFANNSSSSSASSLEGDLIDCVFTSTDGTVYNLAGAQNNTIDYHWNSPNGILLLSISTILLLLFRYRYRFWLYPPLSWRTSNNAS